MKNTLRNLIALGLFVALFAQPTFAQQVQLTLAQVKAGKMQMQTELITEMVDQSYTVQVPYTENVTQRYTVQVPYTATETQTYEVQVPYTETIIGEDGKKVEVEKNRTEKREREVPVARTRAETKTKVVPVTKMRAETRTRKVPITRRGGKAEPIQFPPADAKFAFVSGKEISNEEIKELATKQITILQLDAGETLSDLHRQILRPDLIVMTLPPIKK